MSASPNDDQPHGPLHVDDLRALLGELLERWEHGAPEATTPRGHSYTQARVKLVAALASHTHQLGRVVATLTDQGFHVETAPTVRSAFEHGLTLQWLVAYGDDAMWGVVNEGLRQRRNAGESLKELKKIMDLDGAQRVLDVLAHEQPGDPSGADQPARHVKSLCDDVQRGNEFYFMYRTLSAFVHPGIPLAELYIDRHEPVEIRLTPRPVSDPRLRGFIPRAAR